MYGVNKNTSSGERVENVPGVNENMNLVKVVAEPLNPKVPDSQIVINAYFNNGKGGFDVKYTYFEIDAQKIKDQATDKPVIAKFSNKTLGIQKDKVITPKQALDLAVQQFNGNIKALFNKFVPDNEIEIAEATSWKEFAKNVENFYNSKKDKITAQVRLFLVYEKTGKFLKPRPFDWIESMTVNPTKLKVGPKDNITPATPDKEEPTTETNTESDNNSILDQMLSTSSGDDDQAF